MISFNCLECGNELKVKVVGTGIYQYNGPETKEVEITFRYCNTEYCGRYLLLTELEDI